MSTRSAGSCPSCMTPTGHEVRFYTMDSHRELPADGEVIVINDPREPAEAAEEATSESTDG
jgi:hypothetical protein